MTEITYSSDAVVYYRIMAAAEILMRGAEMGKEFRLFRQSLLEEFCEAFVSLDREERDRFAPPDNGTIERAWELFCRLEIRRLSPSAILPAPDGGVAFCFSRDDRYADLECLNTGSLLGVTSNRHGSTELFRIDGGNPSEVDHALSRIGQFLGTPEDALSSPAQGR